MPLLTVIIPTHNPRSAILARVLDHLRNQSLASEHWLAVLVDNASSPPVSEVECRRRLPSVTIVREPRAGLLYARIAGIRYATGRAIVFVDDDNLLDRDYLRNAAQFLVDHPAVGVFGGRVVPEFETAPAAWAMPHLGHLALRDYGDATLTSQHRATPTTYDYFAPIGAGMVIRANYARQLVKSVESGAVHAVGRKGQYLGSCEDCDLVLMVWSAGAECAYAPGLRLVHVIPSSRLRFRYLQRLLRQGMQSWGEFAGRHEYARPINRVSLPLRMVKAFVTHRAWTRGGFIAWRGTCGYFIGLARASGLARTHAS
jgi:glycosyltransferase involved in cell wall biosynthesis